MADGNWSSGAPVVSIRQAGLNRERVLTVSTAAPPGTNESSGFASSSPIAPPAGASAPAMGPHFIMSPETMDGRPTTGFGFGLLGTSIPFAQRAIAAAPGFTVTVWVLVANTMVAIAGTADWLSFQPFTPVNYNEYYRSFDINTAAVRFQIGNVLTDGLLQIVFTEL